MRIDTLTPQPGSVGNQNFRLDAEHDSFALKLAADSELAAERWGLERAATADVPVPRVLASGPLSDGRGFLITAWLGAQTVRDSETDALVEGGRALRRFHGVTGPGYGRVVVTAGGAAGRHQSWEAFLDNILGGIDDLVRYEVISSSLSDRVRAAVADHRDAINYPETGVLLHCDLKPAHLLVADGRLAAIIDWGDTSFGDPRWDLARLRLSGDTIFTPVLDGYLREDQELARDGRAPALLSSAEVGPGSDFDRAIGCLGAILRLDALHYELMAGGDWFDVYRSTIEDWIDTLAPVTR